MMQTKIKITEPIALTDYSLAAIIALSHRAPGGQCNALELSYDVRAHVGRIILPTVHCTVDTATVVHGS